MMTVKELKDILSEYSEDMFISFQIEGHDEDLEENYMSRVDSPFEIKRVYHELEISFKS